MRPHDVQRWLKRKPFKPFRLLLTTGLTYEVRHPERLLVSGSTAVLEQSSQMLIFKMRRLVEIALVHIVQVEEIPSPPETN